MPPGAAAPSLDSGLSIIFHNIPYANLGCGIEPGPFGYPLAAVKEIAHAPGVHAGVSSAQFHG